MPTVHSILSSALGVRSKERLIAEITREASAPGHTSRSLALRLSSRAPRRARRTILQKLGEEWRINEGARSMSSAFSGTQRR